jgi:hypothetical protein
MDNIEILLLPISYGLISNELGIFMKIHELGYRPDVVMCVSGGGISSHLFSSAGYYNDSGDFRKKMMLRLKYLEKEHLFENHDNVNWVFYNILNTMRIPSLMREGKELDENLFGFEMENQPEIWYSTIRKTKGKDYLPKIDLTFWTNKDQPKMTPNNRHNVSKFETSKESDKIVRACSSIQFILPEVDIGDDSYSDAGLISATPMSFFYDSLLPDDSKAFRIMYVSSINITDVPIGNISIDFFTYIKLALGFNYCALLEKIMNNYVKKIVTEDAENIIDFMTKNYTKGKMYYYEGSTDEELKKSLIVSKKSKISFVFIMPRETQSFDIFNYKKGKIAELSENVYRGGFMYKHWFINY